MSTVTSPSFWLGRKPYVANAALAEDLNVDIAIIGGGFTGLWSAIQLKVADPSISIAILEGTVIGFGASGRNGGFGMTMIGRNIHQLVRMVGTEQARATHQAMVTSLRELEAFVAEERIDADVVRTGLLTASNGVHQDIRIRQDVEAGQKCGVEDFRYLDEAGCRALVDAKHVRCGFWEEHALLVDPAALARGLKTAAVRRGVLIFENTKVDSFGAKGASGVEIHTAGGTVRADRAIVSTNAYAHAIPALRRLIFTICAYITLTEPLSDEQWKRIGWDMRMGVEDKRTMPHFFRPTADGRILWGGRDAPLARNGPDPALDRDERIFGRLEETFRWTFPQLQDVKIAHTWGGPVCGTVKCVPVVRWLKGDRILYALGYAGHGVGPTHLVGKVVRDTLLGRDSDLRRLPISTLKPLPLPPEPIRGLVLNTSMKLLLKADDTEGQKEGPLVRFALTFLQ